MKKIRRTELFYKMFYGVVSFLIGLVDFSRGFEGILPTRIGSFHLNKVIRDSKPFLIGIYRNKHGKKAVAKIWTGKTKDLNYFALANEILVYKLLTKVAKRSNVYLPKEIRNVSIPFFYGSYDKKGKLILLTQYISGKKLDELSEDVQISEYSKTSSYFRFLGGNFTVKERNILTTKSVKYFVEVFPLIFISSIVRNPRLAKNIFKSGFTFLRGIGALYKDHNFVLIHGDLHPGNILINNRKTIVLDLEQSCFSYPEYEIVSTLLCRSVRGSFLKFLFKNVRNSGAKSNTFRKKFSSLFVNCSVHYLTGDNPKIKVDLFVKSMKFAESFIA